MTIIIAMLILWFPAYLLFEMLVARISRAFTLLLRTTRSGGKSLAQ